MAAPEPLPAQGMAARLWPYCNSAGRVREGLEAMEHALRVGTALPLQLAGQLLVGMALLHYHHRGALGESRRRLLQAIGPLTLAGDRELLLFAQVGLTDMAVHRLEPDVTGPSEQTLAACEGSPYLSGALMVKGDAHRIRGEQEPARAYYERAVELCRRTGSLEDLAMAYGYLAQLELDWTGDLDRTEQALRTGGRLADELPGTNTAAFLSNLRGRLAIETGDTAVAEERLAATAEWAERFEGDRRLCEVRCSQAELYLRQENGAAAADACAESLRLAVAWENLEVAREALGVAAQLLSRDGRGADSARLVAGLRAFHRGRGWPLPRRAERLVVALPSNGAGDPPPLSDLATEAARLLENSGVNR